MPKGFGSGRLTDERYKLLLTAWCKAVSKHYPDTALLAFSELSDFAESSSPPIADITFDVAPAAVGGGATKAVEGSGSFKVGDKVVNLRKASWPCPTKANAAHRKDINVGEEGTVIGLGDIGPVVTFSVVEKGRPQWTSRVQ